MSVFRSTQTLSKRKTEDWWVRRGTVYPHSLYDFQQCASGCTKPGDVQVSALHKTHRTQRVDNNRSTAREPGLESNITTLTKEVVIAGLCGPHHIAFQVCPSLNATTNVQSFSEGEGRDVCPCVERSSEELVWPAAGGEGWQDGGQGGHTK